MTEIPLRKMSPFVGDRRNVSPLADHVSNV